MLHRKVEKRYPTAPSTIELTNNFADFLDKKIATIRTELANEMTSTIQSCGANEQPCHVELTKSRVMSAREVERFVDKIGKQSCDLDPIPASILKECKSTLLPIFTNMVNMSLQSAYIPATLKEAMIKLKLKKDNLDSEDYPNFRPISNLKVVSKIIEKAVSCQLIDYLRDNDLEESFQSANSLLYRLPTFLIDRLQNVQNAAARIITRVTRTKKYDHITPVLKQLHWLPVNQRINYKILLLTYKALNGQAPIYITELLEPYAPTRNLRSSSKNLLKIPPVKLVSYGHGTLSPTLSDRGARYQVLRPIRKHTFLKNVIT